MFPEEGCFPIHFMEKAKKSKPQHERKREFIFGAEPQEPHRRTALLLGPKESGKTALINSFANLINNVNANSPYRLHITPVKEAGTPNSSMNYASTVAVSSYVFQHTPVASPVALVDTPSLGCEESSSSGSAVHQIKRWIEQDYRKPVEDLEIWMVISAMEAEIPKNADHQLREILDCLKWKVRVIPVITFAKRRKPMLALKTLAHLGFQCEHEGVDFFTVNNGSVLGLSTELLETNALSFDESMRNMMQLLLTSREPPEQGRLVPLHVVTISPLQASAKHTGTSNSPSDDQTISSPSSDDEPTHQAPHISSLDLSDPARSPPPPEEPESLPPPPLPSDRPLLVPAPRHHRLNSHDSGIKLAQQFPADAAIGARDDGIFATTGGPVSGLRLAQHQSVDSAIARDGRLFATTGGPVTYGSAAPRHSRMRSFDSAMIARQAQPRKQPPTYEQLAKKKIEHPPSRPSSLNNLQRRSGEEWNRCKDSNNGQKPKKQGFVSISPYETLV